LSPPKQNEPGLKKQRNFRKHSYSKPLLIVITQTREPAVKKYHRITEW